MIQPLLRAIDRVCLASAWVAAILLAVMALLGMAEILSRWWFNYSIPIAFEYSSYMLSFILFGGSAWALRDGGHIRVSLILQPLSASAVRVVDFIATAFALGVSVYMSIALVSFTIVTFERNSLSFFPSQTPLGWPQTALSAGVCFISLALLARLIRIVIREAPEATKAGKSLEETSL